MQSIKYYLQELVVGAMSIMAVLFILAAFALFLLADIGLWVGFEHLVHFVFGSL